MSHSHSHSCTCKHEDVKFCSHCNIVYCKGCNQEWTKRSLYNSWYTQPYWNTALQGRIYTAADSAVSTTATINSGGTAYTVNLDKQETPESTCKHSS